MSLPKGDLTGNDEEENVPPAPNIRPVGDDTKNSSSNTAKNAKSRRENMTSHFHTRPADISSAGHFYFTISTLAFLIFTFYRYSSKM